MISLLSDDVRLQSCMCCIYKYTVVENKWSITGEGQEATLTLFSLSIEEQKQQPLPTLNAILTAHDEYFRRGKRHLGKICEREAGVVKHRHAPSRWCFAVAKMAAVGMGGEKKATLLSL